MAETTGTATAVTPPDEIGALFWNSVNNIADKITTEPGAGYDFNREWITYIQADPRYVTYLEKYLDGNNDMTDAQKEDMLVAGTAVHMESDRVLNETPGYSTDMQKLANDFYFTVEHTEMDQKTQLGELAIPPAEGDEINLVTAPMAVEDPPLPFLELEEIVVYPDQEDPASSPITTGAIEAPPLVSEFNIETALPPEAAPYTVGRGDNLWKIARTHYGLTSNADIMKAVETIAHANGLDKGTDANNIARGQVLMLPADPSGTDGQKPLNWAALDQQTQDRLRVGFTAAAATTTVASVAPTHALAAPAFTL